jgi:hypothetical protein
MQSLRGYATGGMVGGSVASAPAMTASLSLSDSDVSRIAGALLSARPMYGDVHISGDPTTFRQQMQSDRRASALDGVRR